MQKTYELLAHKAQNYNSKRFVGKRVQASKAKQDAIRKREQRLNNIGLSLMLFQS